MSGIVKECIALLGKKYNSEEAVETAKIV